MRDDEADMPDPAAATPRRPDDEGQRPEPGEGQDAGARMAEAYLRAALAQAESNATAAETALHVTRAAAHHAEAELAALRATMARMRRGEADHRAHLERQAQERTAEPQASRDLLRAATNAPTRESGERQAFLLKLSDALRPLRDAADIQAAAARLLGEHLGASRVAYVDVPGDEYVIACDYTDGVPSMAGRYPTASFGPGKLAEYRTGRTRVVHDTLADPHNAAPDNDSFAAVGVRAGIGVPLVKEGVFAANLVVHMDVPRNWTPEDVALVEETADRTWAAVERARAEAALRESEARLAAVFEVLPVGVGVFDAHGALLLSNQEMRRFMPTGTMPSRDAVRRSRWQARHPDGRPVEPQDFPGACALRGERVVPGIEMLHTDDDGREVWTNASAVPLRDHDGRVTGAAVVVADVDAVKRTAEALRESEERLRQFGEASSDVLWIRDAETLRWEYLTPAFEAIYGLGREQALGGGDLRHWAEFIVPEDQERALRNLERVRAGEQVAFEYRIRRASDGEVRWVRDADFPMRGPPDAGHSEGRVQRIGGIGRDVTERKAAADRVEVMVAELQHRTRNLIAVVRSIAQQTMAASGGSLEAFRGAFNDRLSALSRVQGLLSRAEQEPITIGMLLGMELDALGAEAKDGKQRVVLDGPKEVRLRTSAVQTLALALHELATNARNHGALGDGGGRLRVTWRVRDGEGAGLPRLALEWAEEGAGRPRQEQGTAPAPYGGRDRGGYGRELIERALPYALGAKTSYELTDVGGVRCTIDLPLDRPQRRGGKQEGAR